VEKVREKILEIIKKEENLAHEKFSITFLKNIDKINKTETKELLSTLFGQGSNSSKWKYKKQSRNPNGSIEEIDAIPNLSKFVFVASSSDSDPKNLEDLHKSFRTIEVPLSNNQLIIFALSGGLEIIIFFFLVRSKRKSQHEKLQQFDEE